MTDDPSRLVGWARTLTAWRPPHRRAIAVDLQRRVRRARSDLHGAVARLRYKRTYGHPDLDVAPDVLADRVRSSLGPLEHRLDLPRVHVMAEGRTVLLHGDVATPADAEAIEHHVAGVAGVDAVESHLHVGLLPSDTRPSVGRAVPVASPARHQLEAAARHGGCPAAHTADAVSAVLTVLLRRLPATEANHVLTHLPSDVRVLVRRRTQLPWRPARSVDKFVWQVTVQSDHLTHANAASVTPAVITALRALVPEEARGVAEVLPEGLRPLWTGTEAPEASPAHATTGAAR